LFWHDLVRKPVATFRDHAFRRICEYKEKQTLIGKPRRRVRMIAALACALRRVEFILSKTRFVMVNAWFASRRNSALIAVDIKSQRWGCEGAGVQRKVFRVEQMFAGRRAAAAAADPAEQRHLVDKLKTLRALVERHDGTAVETV
jgi:hypothetical protein